jgi:aminomethyltransferase
MTLFDPASSRWGHLVEPGISLWQQGKERHELTSRQVAIHSLSEGDRLDILDVDGARPCYLCFFDHAGRAEPAGLDRVAGDPAPTSLDWNDLADGLDPGARARLAAFHRRAATPAFALFPDSSAPNRHYQLVANQPGTCLLVAPSPEMTVTGDHAPATVELLITRRSPRETLWGKPPEPLADPLQDIHVPHSSAVEYEVRAGEFIQIIDLSGRQCSDFQGLTLRGLDKGRELEIDHTTTRSLNGNAYPGPGLHSKFFNVDQEPMFEVIRDTVGRHDTFGLACFARFYEEMGYPGHINCTDNMNAALERYQVGPRVGWEAVNFFFNSRAEHDNSLSFDEAWSRPGDYVLLRALTDCVCVSTSCPNDLDPANGWNPTDIQVRTYSEKQVFSKSVAIRMTPDSSPKLTRDSAFHPRTSEIAKEFTDMAGVWLPASYRNQGAIAEYYACREGVMMMDMSSLRKFEVTGPDAEALLNLALTRNVAKLSVGQVAYSAMCHETGGMIDDGTLFRLGQDLFRWVCAEDYCGVWLRELAEKNNFKAWVKSSTEVLANMAVQGPMSRDTLRTVIWTRDNETPLDGLDCFRFSVARLGGFDGAPLVVSRTGYTGELGYEIFCHPKHAVALWDAVADAGAPFGITPCGFDALEMIRIEAGLVMGHAEFDGSVDPFEAGIGFTVPLKSKSADFVGRAALEARKQNGRACLAGLELSGNEVPRHGDKVFVGRAEIGVVTSATRSPILDKTIALCRLDMTHAQTGTQVEIGKLDGHQKRLIAKVVPQPFYDPERRRMRG